MKPIFFALFLMLQLAFAGHAQTVAIGTNAGSSSQGGNAVAIGSSAGQVSQGAQSVAIGPSAGSFYQSSYAVALGLYAGGGSQGAFATALGPYAGCFSQSFNAIAIGFDAGYQSQSGNAVALGSYAGYTNQGTYAVAIGYGAGCTNQGTNAVAIGYGAGTVGQSSSSIVINATGAELDAANEGFYVAPLRSNVGTTRILSYDPVSAEVTYGDASLTLAPYVSNTATSIAGLSNALTSALTQQVSSLSNALSAAMTARVTTLSNGFAQALAVQSLGFSNSLASGLGTEGTILSNSLAALSNQIAALPSSLQGTIQMQCTSLSNSLTAGLSNALASLASQLSPTNPAFLEAVASGIRNASNSYGFVTRMDQSLSFAAIPSVTYSPRSAPIPLSAISSAGLSPVTFTSANTSVAAISGDQLIVKGAGSTTITASQSGDPLRNPVSATQPFVVNPIVQKLSFAAIAPQTYAKGKVVPLTVSSSAALPVTLLIGNYSVATNAPGNAILLLGKGTTTITATNSGSANYTPAGAVQTLIVK